MTRRNLVLACSVAIALGSLPGAAALWSSSGGIEPDYAPDVDLGLMFAETDVDSNPEHMQIYFNAYRSPVWSGANPNVGATGTSLVLPVFNNAIAFLGVWKDCNKDGYIGHAESALVEYRSELLLGEDDVCPDGTAFNNEGWVYELLSVIDGYSFAQNSKPTRFINSSEVRVWGDLGRPPAEQPGTGGGDGSCFVNPPIGFFYSTGAMLDFSDCLIGHEVVRLVTGLDNGEYCRNTTAGEVCSPAPGLGLGIGFDNCADGVDCEDGENAQCSDSLLNQRVGVWSDAPECREEGYVGLMDNCGAKELRADPDNENPCDMENNPNPDRAFSVWDCSAATEVVVPHPVNQDNASTQANESRVGSVWLPGGVAPAAPIVGDPEGHRSVAQGADEATGACNPSGGPAGVNSPEQDVEQGATIVTNRYVLTYVAPIQGRNVWEGNTCGVTLGSAFNPVTNGQPVRLPPNTPVTNSTGCTNRIAPDTPSVAGTRPPTGVEGLLPAGPIYWSGVTSCCSVLPTLETRGSGLDTTVDGEGPSYATFYAYVEKEGITFDEFITAEPNRFEQIGKTVLFPGGEGFFGDEWCDGNFGEDAGVFGGFECDASKWYRDTTGASNRPTSANGTKNLGAVPGEKYNLRDIDCFDGSLMSRGGVHTPAGDFDTGQDTEGLGVGLTRLDSDSDGDGQPDDAAGPCHLVRE